MTYSGLGGPSDLQVCVIELEKLRNQFNALIEIAQKVCDDHDLQCEDVSGNLDELRLAIDVYSKKEAGK